MNNILVKTGNADKIEKSFQFDTSKSIIKKNKINYSLITYISSKKKSDIYLGDKVIFAKNYKIYDIEPIKEIESKVEVDDDDSPSLFPDKNGISNFHCS